MTCMVNRVALTDEHMGHLAAMCAECDIVKAGKPLMSRECLDAFCRNGVERAFVSSPNVRAAQCTPARDACPEDYTTCGWLVGRVAM